jgi:phosphoglycolate phosphatase-like HAD superfamily hydrolase
MKLVMFDIDGTLTQTVRADEICYIRALEEAFDFKEINQDWSSYPHCSDSGILEELFQKRRGRSPFPAEISDVQSWFVALLHAAAASDPFGPIPGAESFINGLLSRPEFAISLASGGWECSSRLKLASAGLGFSGLPAAFSDKAHAREDIMRASLAHAARHYGRTSFDTVFYFGDGIWDVRAAQNLGYQFIGIASDPVKMAKLCNGGADQVFPDYVDSTAILAALRAS